ncbi:MAG: hypothetical protein U5K71_09430 [Gracilimonas sp.]|nr:hypothetical protein [Gracilimonas sp.]
MKRIYSGCVEWLSVLGKSALNRSLRKCDIQPILEQVMAYMERRLPRLGKAIEVRKDLSAQAMVQDES